MFRLPSALRAAVLYGLLAASHSEAITPSPVRPRADAPAITAVSDCHVEGTELYCHVETAEYRISGSVTASSYTDCHTLPGTYRRGCHSHGIETFCEGPNGDEVEIHLATEEEHDETGSSTEPHCHFHAGVEHCTGGSESESSQPTCARVQRDYNIRLRVGLLFVMLATSSIGVFTPILIASYVSPNHAIFTVLRQFGTGVIISTAFIHLFTHANLMFQNECLGELAYESTASAILMAGLFLSFLIEYAGNRLIQWHESKAKPDSTESAEHAHSHEPTTARTDMVNITVLECGVIFHSLLIGLTLVVAGDTFFLTLFAVIVFHQMFEGVALGTRIAALGKPCPASTSTPEGGEP
ncbi:high-affinity Zn(2+) transporter zrt1 [Collariella sp. IMI 366227]|nr:high-affinity Zn(2+) transporter zrt1 [Collariella sp. IMI 366227]